MMKDELNVLPSGGIQSGATRFPPDASHAASNHEHPHAGALRALLDSPNEATIGALAALLQSISRDLSFFPGAMRDGIEAAIPRSDGKGLIRGDQPLGREELEALGTLLSAQARDTKAREE